MDIHCTDTHIHVHVTCLHTCIHESIREPQLPSHHMYAHVYTCTYIQCTSARVYYTQVHEHECLYMNIKCVCVRICVTSKINVRVIQGHNGV